MSSAETYEGAFLYPQRVRWTPELPSDLRALPPLAHFHGYAPEPDGHSLRAVAVILLGDRHTGPVAVVLRKDFDAWWAPRLEGSPITAAITAVFALAGLHPDGATLPEPAFIAGFLQGQRTRM